MLQTRISRASQLSSGILLLDFNCVMSRHLDRQPVSSTPTSSMSNMLRHLSTESDLTHIWRNKHRKGKDFTFFSHRHSSYSRIDLFLTPKAESYRVVRSSQFHYPITLLSYCRGALVTGHQLKNGD